ncbi:MAG: hypothetical protein QOD06_2755, partial [Candidatus Binatota bacterium]|nr:hypothetical protein [Candidatus Binatota bacterium]
MSWSHEEVQQVRFIVVRGANRGAEIDFPPGARSIRIGRAGDNEIVIGDPTVSRAHARVEVQQDHATIADLGSAAGVEKMGFRVGRDPEPLESGDEFKLGDTILRFEVILKKGAQKRAAARQAAAAASEPAAPHRSPVAEALARLGLTTPAKRLTVALLLAVLVGVLLWPAPAGLPPQSGAPLAIDYNRPIGFLPIDQTHLDAAVFEVPSDVEGVVLYFHLLPVSGVEIRSEARAIARVEPAGSWNPYELLMIPRALATGGRTRLAFDNLGYAPSDGDLDPAEAKPWGVANMWIARTGAVGSSLGQISASLQGLSELAARLGDDPANRYELAKGLRQTAIGLMKLAGRATYLVRLPAAEEAPPAELERIVASAVERVRDDRAAEALAALEAAIRGIEGEINREYRKLSN